MVDISGKFEQIMKLIEQGEYFTISRPRQYGKTTMLETLFNNPHTGQLVFYLSFEGTGDIFRSERIFCTYFVEMLAGNQVAKRPEIAKQVSSLGENVANLKDLSKFITTFTNAQDKNVIVLIDEIDKSSNNQLFLSFLGMLRDKYLKRKRETTFTSVILAGVHDVKSLKLKIRKDTETKLNSPWNIAADFNVDMSFKPCEIKTLLTSYAEGNGVKMDFDKIAERVHYYTDGYPFLVSKICKNVDEEEAGQNPDYKPKHWTVGDIDWSFRWLTRPTYTTTNFDDVIKNLENNPDLYSIAFNIVISGADFSASYDNPAVNLGYVYGIFSSGAGKLRISNRVYEQRLYNYMVSKQETAKWGIPRFSKPAFLTDDGGLDFSKILLKFQEFMKEHYLNKDEVFLERHGRLLFMSHLKPIINGEGFDFKEPVVGDERRIDLAVTFRNKRYVVELKRWEGQKAHEAGLKQLSDYLESCSLKKGYLLIFDFNKNKKYKSETISCEDKEIFAVWV
jgi:hypothetical protein